MKEKWEKEDFESLRTFSEIVNKNDIFVFLSFLKYLGIDICIFNTEK